MVRGTFVHLLGQLGLSLDWGEGLQTVPVPSQLNSCHVLHVGLPQGRLLPHPTDTPPRISLPQVWSQYEEPPVEDVVTTAEEKERTANYKPVFVTEVTDDLHFYVQDVETGEGQLEGAGLLPHTRFRETGTAGGSGWGRGSRGGGGRGGQGMSDQWGPGSGEAQRSTKKQRWARVGG